LVPGPRPRPVPVVGPGHRGGAHDHRDGVAVGGPGDDRRPPPGRCQIHHRPHPRPRGPRDTLSPGWVCSYVGYTDVTAQLSAEGEQLLIGSDAVGEAPRDFASVERALQEVTGDLIAELRANTRLLLVTNAATTLMLAMLI